MRQNMANVNLAPVVMDSGDEPSLVTADIENGELADLIRMGKHSAHLLDIGKARRLHLLEPLDKACRTVGVQLGELVEPLARYNVHR